MGRIDAGIASIRLGAGGGVVLSGSCEKRKVQDSFLKSQFHTVVLCA